MTLFEGGSPHLHKCAFDDALARTHLGQAHIAGTGPDGRTCRECVFYGTRTKYGMVQSPGYYSKSSKDKPNLLKLGKCNAPMTHKAKRAFPHAAMACRLFEESDAPWPPYDPDAKS